MSRVHRIPGCPLSLYFSYVCAQKFCAHATFPESCNFCLLLVACDVGGAPISCSTDLLVLRIVKLILKIIAAYLKS